MQKVASKRGIQRDEDSGGILDDAVVAGAVDGAGQGGGEVVEVSVEGQQQTGDVVGVL